MAAKTTKEKNPLPKLGRFYEITFRDTDCSGPCNISGYAYLFGQHGMKSM